MNDQQSLAQRQVRFNVERQGVENVAMNQLQQNGNRVVGNMNAVGPRQVLGQVQNATNVQSNSRFNSAVQELRKSFEKHTSQLSASRLTEQTVPYNETTQIMRATPSMPMIQSYYQPQAYCPPPPQCEQDRSCRSYCDPCNPCGNPSPTPFVVMQSSEKKKKKKKQVVEENIQNYQFTPKRQRTSVQRDPEIDNVRGEIQELERIIRQIENQPQQQQKDIEVHIQDDKKCQKKLCKKIKTLEKELYDVARQRDEAVIIRSTLERENNEMFDRIGELEALLKAADKKIFDLTIINERNVGYIRQLEDEVERLRRKKRKRGQTQQIVMPQQQYTQEVRQEIRQPQVQHQEKIIYEDRIVEKPIEIIKEVPVERIVEKIIEVPKIEYVDRIVPQIVEKIVEVPVERTVEVPVPFDRIVEVPVDRPVYQDRIIEVPVDRIVEVPVVREVPVDRIVEQIREVPVHIYHEVPIEVIKEVVVERIKEVPVDRYVEKPVERIVEVPKIEYVDRPVYIEVPVDRVVEVPVERRVEIKEQLPPPPPPPPRQVDHVVEVPVDRFIEVPVEVPVDRVVEVRDDYEIHRLRDENDYLADIIRDLRNQINLMDNELFDLNDRYQREINRNHLDHVDEASYLSDQLRQKEIVISDLRRDLDEMGNRCMMLEQALGREREITSDLQQRLDLMYLEIEKLISENNRKNEDLQRHIIRLEDLLRQKQEKPIEILKTIGAGGQLEQMILNQNVAGIPGGAQQQVIGPNGQLITTGGGPVVQFGKPEPIEVKYIQKHKDKEREKEKRRKKSSSPEKVMVTSPSRGIYQRSGNGYYGDGAYGQFRNQQIQQGQMRQQVQMPPQGYQTGSPQQQQRLRR